MERVNDNTVYFAKVKEGAIIPSKKLEDAGYDVYACFEEDYIEIKPNEIKMIPTGIASAFNENYYMQLQERGSTGTKGLSQRCGVIDSGFRNQWQVPINNTTNRNIIILKGIEDTIKTETTILYPYTKAICQAVLLPVPKVEIKELDYEDLKQIDSERGMTMLGASGK